jgi:4-hydroxybenzoyl-CoA reductase subunit beta
MEVLPNFSVVTVRSIEDVVKARAEHGDSRLLGGGTDLVVNVRHGIVAPKVMIDVNRVEAMKALACGPDGLKIGASVTLAMLAAHADVVRYFPAIARAAGSIAGPTHRHMGTVGGNLCLDTRCIFYNQSEWWRGALNHCLKTTGTMCHVAPKSRGVCFATFSGDLAPAFLIFGAEVDIAGPAGHRTLPLENLYIGYARQDQPITEALGDGKHYLALRPGEFIVSVRVKAAPKLVSGYDKIRIRRSIEYPVAGVAVALRRDGDALAELRVAITGTNPRPVLITGTERLCGGTLDREALKALDALVLDQVMSMKTTFTPGHYRRRMASVLARRLVTRLFSEAASD